MGHRPDWNNQNFKKGSVRKFADGGEVEAREAAREGAITFPLPEREPIVDTYEYGRYEEQEENRNRTLRDMAAQASKELEDSRVAQEESREAMPKSEAKPAKQSFKEAFASAKDGSVFTWENPKTGKTESFKKEYAKPSKADYSLGKLHVSAKRDNAVRDYGDETERMKSRAPKPAPKPEPRKFMGMEVVETDAQRKASDAYRAANPFLKDKSPAETPSRNGRGVRRKDQK